MKKLLLVKLTIIVLILGAFTSCVSTNSLYNDEILNLTTKLAITKNVDEALSLYDMSYKRTKDIRLIYNKAVYLASNGLYDSAFDLCLEHKDNNEFRDLALKYASKISNQEKAYNYALELWEEGFYSKESVTVLYCVDNDEWAKVMMLFSEE